MVLGHSMKTNTGGMERISTTTSIFSSWLRTMIANGKRLMCGFGNEYSMGGIVVNEKFETDIPGLYTAGEVTGGLFGAFRSGDGLTGNAG